MSSLTRTEPRDPSDNYPGAETKLGTDLTTYDQVYAKCILLGCDHSEANLIALIAQAVATRG
jgi:hypothetical protein